MQAFTAFGTTSRVPMLWVYAANDSYFRPGLARRFHDMFRAGGGKATFIAAPPYGDDGHYLYSAAGRAQWTPYLDAFLRERGLGHEILSLPDPLPSPRQLNEAARAEFARYLASMLPHKAFAVSPNGSYGWRAGRVTADDARRDSLAACMKWSSSCVLYAVDDRLAESSPARPTDQSARAR